MSYFSAKSPSQNLPNAALPCHYVEQHELVRGLETGAKFCEFYEPGNYFAITARPDSYTIEGWLGRPDHHSEYFEHLQTNFTFFKDYELRKPVCFTFDRITLFQVVTIIPEKPLKFVLKQVLDRRNLISMINQEEIYQFIQKKQWSSLLDILYKHKHEIASDTLLQQSARIFENEFLNAIKDHPSEDTAFTELMEKLYMLHAGKFFSLNPASHKSLVLHLAKRKKDKDAYNYAMEYSEEPEMKKIVEQYASTRGSELNR